jgi:hypothetical protein
MSLAPDAYHDAIDLSYESCGLAFEWRRCPPIQPDTPDSLIAPDKQHTLVIGLGHAKRTSEFRSSLLRHPDPQENNGPGVARRL